ncbi:MAG: hypothetical protein K5666_02220 [Bacilli bacterium]|nr:hypothetical protein [Bacilli bacterium]
MENINLNEIQIKDFEYHCKETSRNFLKRHNITTIAQLVDDDLMDQLLARCGPDTRIELRVMISLAKYKYLGIPLPLDALLDKKLIIEEYEEGRFRFFVLVDNIKKKFFIREFLGIHDVSAKHIERDFVRKSGISGDDIKLIDFFKWISISGYCGDYIERIALTYIESYEKSKKADINPNDINTIESLKKQLADVLDMKKQLDAQINDLKEKINQLSQSEDKGGTQK